MLSRKSFLSWIVASIVMFSLSYLWHGVILNDFAKISYPKEVYLSLFTVLYFIIGLVLALGYTFFANNKNPIPRGLLIGGFTGFILFLIVFVLGISFQGRVQLTHAVIDFLWQVIEQGIGGMAVAFVYSVVERREQLMHQ